MSDIPVEQERVNAPGPGGAAPIPPGMITPQVMGVQVGDALGTASEVATRIHRDAVQEFNQTVALDAHNKLHEFEQQKFYDPQNGLFNQHLGKDAPGAVDAAKADYQQKVAQISDTLPNDKAKAIFQRMAQERGFQLQDLSNHWESNELETYHRDVYSTGLKNAGKGVVDYVNQVARTLDTHGADDDFATNALTSGANLHIEEGQTLIQQEGDRRHLPQTTIDEQKAEFASSAHYSVIRALNSQGQDRYSNLYYGAVKDDLQGEQADHAADMVRSGNTANEALRIYKDIGVGKDGAPASYDDFQKKLSGITDAKVYDRVFELYQRGTTAYNKFTNENDREWMSQAQDAATDHGCGSSQYKAALENISDRRRGAADAAFKAYSMKVAKGEVVHDDPQTYLACLEMVKDPNRVNDFLPELFCDKLSPAKLAKLVNMKAEALKRNGETDPKTEAVQKVINDTFANQFHLDPHATWKENPEVAQKMYQFDQWFRDALAQNEADNGGKALGWEKLRKLADLGAEMHDINSKQTPTYQIPGTIARVVPLGSRLWTGEAEQWQQAMYKPGSPEQVSGISTLKQWSQGIGDQGRNDALKDRYKAVLGRDYQNIIDSYQRIHGTMPSDDYIIDLWAGLMKGRAPKAPPQEWHENVRSSSWEFGPTYR